MRTSPHFSQLVQVLKMNRSRLVLMLLLINMCALAAAEQPAPALAAQPSDLPKDAVAIPMRLFADRVFITAKVNDEANAECLIDTGAEISLINKARVKLKNLQITGTEQLQGAFVGGVAMQKAILPSLQIGERVHKNIGIGVIDHREGQKLGQIDMLLGMDVLARTRFTLDFEHERLILWAFRSPLPDAPKGYERERLPLRRGTGESLPKVDGVLNGKTRVNFLVDSGAGGPFFVAFQKLSEYGFDDGAAEVGRLRLNDGGKGTELIIRETVFKRLEFGKLAVENVSGRVIDASVGVGPLAKQDLQAGNNVLGTPFLKRLSAAHFDMPGGCLYFDRKKPDAIEKK